MEEEETNIVFRVPKDDEIAKVNRKIIDLAIHDTTDRTNNKQ